MTRLATGQDAVGFFGEAPSTLVASIVIPVRNEEALLPRTLDSLRAQVDLNGAAYSHRQYEVLLLLNNCTDRTCSVVQSYQALHPEFALHFEQKTYAPGQAHVGTARRYLMDAAYKRLLEARRDRDDGRGPRGQSVILTTDADTVVAPDWLACNLAVIAAGADAVGGAIRLLPAELAAMDAQTRAAYEEDARYQAAVAELEARLDPDAADPWPRHLHHFGASLACTCAAYRASGGMPAITPLEDVAFVDALRRSGARLRHAPEVAVYTSARLQGRVAVGLSGQLQIWQTERRGGVEHRVESAAWLTHRFTMMHWLRGRTVGLRVPPPAVLGEAWLHRIERCAAVGQTETDFLAAVDCNACIEESFTGARHQQIGSCIADLEHLLGVPQERVNTSSR